jgi:hypothetical protein
MDIDTANMIFSGIRLVGGFFDFLVFVALLVVALMYVRKVDGTLGYILTGALRRSTSSRPAAATS